MAWACVVARRFAPVLGWRCGKHRVRLCLGEGSLKESGRIPVGSPERRTGGELLNAGFIGGLAIAPNGQTLYAVQVFGQAVSAIDLPTRKEIKKVAVAAEPYTALISPGRSHALRIPVGR